MLESTERHPLVNEVEGLLEKEGMTTSGLGVVLNRVLTHFDGAVGTIHFLDPASGMLQLLVQQGIPEALLSRVQQIPLGKGMAGIAAERREPVQVCNLQTDASGVAKPGAKETRMEGSIAVPMLESGTLRGVLGVGKPVVYQFSDAEIILLQAVAAVLAKYCVGQGGR